MPIFFSKSSAAVVVPFVFSLAALGCGQPPSVSKPATSTATTTSAGPSDRHVYRLDFVLTAHDEQTRAPSSTTFTLNLQEYDKGEVHVGENVSLAAPTGAPAPRSDVGAKVVATYKTVGDDILLDVGLDVSSFYPPSNVEKVVVRSNALAAPGKSSTVTTLKDEHRRYELTVTPTKLR